MSLHQHRYLVPSVALDSCDLSLFDVVEQAQTFLDEAEKLFAEGHRMAGMYKLGQAASILESAQ